jgi:hypothetical protein
VVLFGSNTTNGSTETQNGSSTERKEEFEAGEYEEDEDEDEDEGEGEGEGEALACDPVCVTGIDGDECAVRACANDDDGEDDEEDDDDDDDDDGDDPRTDVGEKEAEARCLQAAVVTSIRRSLSSSRNSGVHTTSV